MKAEGHYNENSLLQKFNITKTLSSLSEAVRHIDVKGHKSFQDGSVPLVIVDYGCSQGKNSIEPVSFFYFRIKKTRWHARQRNYGNPQ